MNNYKINKKCRECKDCGGGHFDDEGNCTLSKCHNIKTTEIEYMEFEAKIAKVSDNLSKRFKKETMILIEKCNNCSNIRRFSNIDSNSSALDPATIKRCKLGLNPKTCK